MAANVEDLYPLGHPEAEQGRLDLQSRIHDRPGLREVLAGRRAVLDLGCGIGSNVPLLRSIEPGIDYTGIDFGDQAIADAKAKFPGERFEVMDATAMSLADESFDFVFANLVFWAIGRDFRAAVAEAYRVLKPGGVLYSFEPDGKTLTFYPPKPAIESAIALWETAMQRQGPDPFVGRKVNNAAQEAGFGKIDTFLYPKISVGTDPDGYRAAAKNLSGVYLGPGAKFLGLDDNDPKWMDAQAQFAQCEPGDLILESYYVNLATRQG
ncbi:MAG: class I SAM-dependent methyltransferase [Planctomycetota bacterium]